MTKIRICAGVASLGTLTILIDGMGRHSLHVIQIPLHYLKTINEYINASHGKII